MAVKNKFFRMNFSANFPRTLFPIYYKFALNWE